ncbi:MAG: hypothetical protein JWM86_762 [Thermoleophilia bacterium]|nr:hypothetical protein [Thermoleophilia bacterium]
MTTAPLIRIALLLSAVTAMTMVVATTARARALPVLPDAATTVLRQHVSAETLARLPELSPVARALRAKAVARPLDDPCSSQVVYVHAAAGDGSVSTTNTGDMRVSCLSYDPGSGVVTAVGAGLDRARFVDVNSNDNIYVAKAPFSTSSDGSRLEVDLRGAACAQRPPGSSFAAYTIYVGTDLGYLAMVGTTFSVTC